jgi:type IV pilus biogenesis protein CpaD/CtpE
MASLTSTRRVVLAVVLGAAILVLAGCGSSDDENAATVSEAYCTALAATVTEAEALATVVAGEPAKDEIEAQHNKLKDAYGTIGETGDDSAGTLQETVTRAYDEFETAIAQLPTDIPASELAVAYREQTGSLQKSLGEVQSEAGC